MTLIPTGAITGRVLDSAGQPAQGANVTAEIFGGNAEGVRADDRVSSGSAVCVPASILSKPPRNHCPFPPKFAPMAP